MMNDKDNTLAGARGSDVHPGVANPTASSTNADPLAANFVTDPTTEATGAGVGSNFNGGRDAQRSFAKTAGVVEGRPGIIESTNIDPLNENSNNEDGWANARSTGVGSSFTNSTTPAAGWTDTASSAAGTAATTAVSAAGTAATVATGAARLAYGHAMGDEAAKQAGKEAIWGKQ